jgi:hypothetical protein
VLTASAIGFRMNRHKASVSKQQLWGLGTKLIEASPHIFETTFGRDLEEEVATINATRDEAARYFSPTERQCSRVGGMIRKTISYIMCAGRTINRSLGAGISVRTAWLLGA